MLVEDNATLKKARETLIKISGRDCYVDGILFTTCEERDAFRWLNDVLDGLIKDKKRNSDKAKCFLVILERVFLHGYLDHIIMHKTREMAEMHDQADRGEKQALAKLAAVEEENRKLRETVDHLASKI